MAGGIFVDQPYHPNIKCLIFAFAMMALYWIPSQNAFLLPAIFVIAYVAMAWYDYMYNCDTIMYSGTALGPNTVDAIFKPQRRIPKNLSKNQESQYLRRVYLFHVLAVVPVLFYVGYFGATANEKIFPVVLTMGVIAFAYHAFRVAYPRQTTC